MKQKSMIKAVIILLVLSAVCILIGSLANSNIAKMIGFVLLIIVTILNIVTKIKR